MRPVDPVVIDARGRPCPLPILALAKAWRTLPPGGQLAVRATDPAFPGDLRAWCEATGAELRALEAEEGGHRAWVAKVLASGPDLPSTTGSL